MFHYCEHSKQPYSAARDNIRDYKGAPYSMNASSGEPLAKFYNTASGQIVSLTSDVISTILTAKQNAVQNHECDPYPHYDTQGTFKASQDIYYETKKISTLKLPPKPNNQP